MSLARRRLPITVRRAGGFNFIDNLLRVRRLSAWPGTKFKFISRAGAAAARPGSHRDSG